MRRCQKCKKEELTLEIEKEVGLCLECQGMLGQNDPGIIYVDDTLEDMPLAGTVEDSPIFVGHQHDYTIGCKGPFERVIIPGKVWAKMSYYCQLAKGEVSGMGTVVQRDDETLEVTNIIMLKQDGSGAHTEMSQDVLDSFMLRLARKGQSLQDWKVWWHTHHDFGTFWSGVDTGNIENMKKILGKKGYLVSINTNQKGDVIARYDDDEYSNPLFVAIKPYKKYSSLRNKCHRQVRRLVKHNGFMQDCDVKILNPYLCGYGMYD